MATTSPKQGTTAAAAVSPTSVMMTAANLLSSKEGEREERNIVSPSAIVHMNTRMHSVVIMSEQGAEVTLRQPRLDETPLVTTTSPPSKTQTMPTMVTPESPSRSKSAVSLPTRSLLDDEPGQVTPIPSPEKGYARTTIFACNGGGCYKGDAAAAASQALTRTTQYSIERTICNLLGSPVGIDDWCTGWQAWSYFEVDNVEDETLELKESVRRVLRNRVSSVNARAQRLHELKRDLQPFDVTPEKDGAKLTRTLSFSLVSRKSSSKTRGMSLSERELDDSNSNDWSFVIRSRGLDASDVYYDSDPEETTRRRTRRNRTKTSRFHGGQVSDGSTRHTSIPQHPTVPDFDDDDSVRHFVQEIINDRYTLILHPNAGAGNRTSCAPVAMTLWIERGQQLSKQLIHPKIVWSQRTQSGGHIPNATLHCADLLDIVRILEIGQIDRKKYPLAHPKKSFLIETLDLKLVFEASSERERDRLVSGLKVAVARLGSKIITEDEGVFVEFFVTPGDEASPWGHAP